MKIAFVTDAYNHGRGGDVATIRMAEGLKKRGHEITVVAAISVETENFFQVKGFYPPRTKRLSRKVIIYGAFPTKRSFAKPFQT